MTRTFRFAFACSFLLAASACTSTPRDDNASSSATVAPPPAADAGAPAAPTQQCNADAAQSAVGHLATDDLIEKARVDAGATIARALKPGQIVTMEYRGDRLNLRVDAKNVVESVACG